jgi:hypothetical protein
MLEFEFGFFSKLSGQLKDNKGDPGAMYNRELI